MAAPFRPGPRIEAGTPRLFQTHALPPGPFVAHSYDVTPDGRRLLINTVVEQAEQPAITVVVNWQAGLKR